MRALGLLLIAPLFAACTYYGGISKAADGKVYLTGSTNFFIFASSFVKRCTESGGTLTCENLTVTDSAAASAKDDGGGDDGGDEAPKKKKKKKKPDDDGGGDSDK